MKIKKLNPEINPITVKDGRGGIFTYYPEQGDPIVEWSFIVTLKGSQRGHHFHKEFDEYIMFVEGNDGSEMPLPVSSGDCVYLPKHVAHTFIPMSDCKMIAMITKKWNDCEEPITKARETLSK